MNLSSFTSFFKKTPNNLTVPDTILVKKLKNLSSQSNLLVYKDVKIYHHTLAYNIRMMLVDKLRGLYLFETKEWTYDELKNAKIEKATKQDSSDNTLAYEKTHDIIRQKFNEVTHADGVPIFNFLLMENLNADEYEHLDESFQELLPREKIIFSDASEADIFKKLQAVSKENEELASIDSILGTLLVQYTMLDHKNKPHFCNNEQIAFIDAKLSNEYELKGVSGSGKSKVLLLKSLVEILNKTAQKIIILKPTLLACDIFKQELLNLIEHAIIDFDLDAIEIITPLMLINRHLEKLGKERVSQVQIDPRLLKKNYHFADIILCDDAHLLEKEFIEYLKHLQAKRHLAVVRQELSQEESQLKINYRQKRQSFNFYETNPHAKALRIIERLSVNESKNILIVCDKDSREKLTEDLHSFINQTPQTIEGSVHLINQIFADISFCTYEDINSLKVDHIILMDLCSISENLLEYAINLSNYSADILYEEECSKIQNLRNRYE